MSEAEKWCRHFWRDVGNGQIEFVSPDDRDTSLCENPKFCPYCGWEKLV